MKQLLYIQAASAISPQHTFDAASFLRPVEHTADGQLYIIDADYRQYISPVAIRRMSKIIKAGISTGMRCLQDAGIQQPDGIITGTGHGSTTDMEVFLKDMINMQEEALNPTYFIQSTYNSINGWLAVQTKSTCYNQTYVHRGFSLELSLFDARLILAESPGAKNILVGCFDEMTPEYFLILSKKGYWKKELHDSRQLFTHSDTTGTIAGEGTAFFAVSNERQQAKCAVLDVKMLLNPSTEELTSAYQELLREYNIDVDGVDILLSGWNGDSTSAAFFDHVHGLAQPAAFICTFKHLCGEYDTANGFALWLANYIFSNGRIPGEIVYRKGTNTALKTMMICNRSMLGNTSLILVAAV